MRSGLYFWIKDLLSRPRLGQKLRPILAPLWPLAWGYGRLQALRRWAYARGLLRSYRPPVPVVSVGNVMAGGTGKTPCVDAVCRYFLGRGLRPAVLSRGYGGRYRGACGCVSDGEQVLMDPAAAGDEPVLLARALPGVVVLVGRDRRVTARAAVERYGADVLVLDDGFQHLRLARDLDILTVDLRNPFGSGRCFPLGLLRESPGSLAAADLVLLTHANRVETRRAARGRAEVARHAPGTPVLGATHAAAGAVRLRDGALQPVSELAGVKALAFAGIGHPEGFFQDLRDLGVNVLQSVPYPDHHAYGAADVEQLLHWAQLMNAQVLLTTEKDAVRLPAELPAEAQVLALRIRLQILEEADRFEEILAQVAGLPPVAVHEVGS